MSPTVLFEAVWLESPASQSGLAKVVEGFLQRAFFFGFGPGWDPDSPEGPWERSWEALLEALGKAHLQRPQKSTIGVLIQLRYRGGPAWPAPNECSRRGEHGL